MKKLIFISGIYPRFKGGAEYQMRLIAEQLKNEYEIVFVYLGDIPGEFVENTSSEMIDGYKVHFIKSCSKLDNVLLKYTYAKRLYQVLELEKPDIVYQRVYKFMSYYISTFQKELGFKHFIHIADLFTIQFNKKNIREKFNYFFLKQTANNKSTFIVQTAEQKKILNTHGIKAALQVYNMHPIKEIDVEEISLKKEKSPIKHIIWVANIRPIKQLEVYIDLATYYKDNENYQFHIIGDLQDANYAQPIMDKVQLLPNVYHYSGKDNIFVNDFIEQKASLVVNSSSSEGFSNVFIQSWLKGVPVLSLNSNPDQLLSQNSEFGVFCNNDNEFFFKSLETLLQNKDYVSQANNCYLLSKKLFSFENVNYIKQLFQK